MYTGPILKIRNGTSNAESDFYIDNTGTIVTTGANGTGTSLTTWLNGATAFVHTWYDQSGAGNHATMTLSNDNQPIFTTTDKVLFSGNRFLVLPSGMLLNGNNPYAFIYKIKNASGIPLQGSTTYANASVFHYGTHSSSGMNGANAYDEIYGMAYNYNSNGRFTNGQWYGAGAASYGNDPVSLIQNNTVVTNIYNTGNVGRTLYINGVLKNTGAAVSFSLVNGTSVNTSGITPSGSNQSNTIGTGRNETWVQNFGGSLDYFCLFRSALTNDADRTTMEEI